MPLFSSLRSRASSSDEKEHDSDSENNNNGNDDAADDSNDGSILTSSSSSQPQQQHGRNCNNREQQQQRTPLLLDPSSASSIALHDENGDNNNNDNNDDSFFSLRIKLNDGGGGSGPIDFALGDVARDSTVGELKRRILLARSRRSAAADNGPDGGRGGGDGGERYLRLIVRGRMMAPDSSPLEKFGVAADDVLHAVLASEGTRGGQQARMLRRMNRLPAVASFGSGGGGDDTGGLASSARRSFARRFDRSLWRHGGGGGSAGGVVSEDSDDDDEDDGSSEEGSEFEDAHGEIDLEAGRGGVARATTTTTNEDAGTPRGVEGTTGRRRRRRERRGFDRLRSTGMTRDEVAAVRLYFAGSVDRHVARRRVMLRATRRPQRDGAAVRADPGAGRTQPRPPFRSSDAGESSINSLLEQEERATSVASNGAGVVEGGTGEGGGDGGERGDVDGPAEEMGRNDNESSVEGEEMLNDRLRMEDEWMSTQGPYSEFRMNLDTNNPLLLAAITGGRGDGAPPHGSIPPLPPSAAGLFFRPRNGLSPLDPSDEDDEDPFYGGAFAPDGAFLRDPRGRSARNGGSPLPSAGTDKDFVWGFILGFFVGAIMLFWVWMPTVPHRQKIGIMSGIGFQMGLNLLRKSGQGL